MNRFGMNAALKTPRVTFIDDDAPARRDGMIAALNRSQAVIEFELDGRILDANENFCRALGYSIDEIRGQHHSLFVDPAHRQSPE